MAKCKECAHLEKRKATVENGYYPWCQKKNDSPDIEREWECDCFKKATHGDKIRAMTDEELALALMCPDENELENINCEKGDNCNCYECLLKWLQSEVEYD